MAGRIALVFCAFCFLQGVLSGPGSETTVGKFVLDVEAKIKELELVYASSKIAINQDLEEAIKFFAKLRVDASSAYLGHEDDSYCVDQYLQEVENVYFEVEECYPSKDLLFAATDIKLLKYELAKFKDAVADCIGGDKAEEKGGKCVENERWKAAFRFSELSKSAEESVEGAIKMNSLCAQSATESVFDEIEKFDKTLESCLDEHSEFRSRQK